jgi:hypothetical protein
VTAFDDHMDSNLQLATIAATGFTVAFFHAAIPTHWLPFVLVSHTRGWSRGKTLLVALFAGLGHVLVTTLFGLAIAWLGFELDEHFGHAFSWIIGGALLLVGLFYFWRQFRGKGVCHHHVPETAHKPSERCGHEGEHDHSHWEEELTQSALATKRKSDWAAISGLFVMLTLSPCEGFLPVYLSGVQFGWRGFVILSAILAIGALAGMLLFTLLTLVGLERVNLKRLERWEAGMLGILFCTLGILFIIIESGHHH